MRRFLVGLFLLLHGLAHAAVGMAAQDAASRFPASGTAELRAAVATALFAGAVAGFVAGALDQWRLLQLGRAWLAAVRSAVFASAMLLAIFVRTPAALAVGVVLDGIAFTLTLWEEPRRLEARAAAGRSWGARVRSAIGLAILTYAVVAIVARPWHRTWGATREERWRPLPGDEHAAKPERAGDRAITIHATPEDVWPWLVQLGQDRGGFYSYASLERLFGIRIENAEQIVPAWQSIAPGDFVRATQPDWLGGVFGDHVGWEVDHVVPNRTLSLRYWVFDVEPAGEGKSRLHARTYAGDPPTAIAPILLLVFEPAHFIMERAMLQGIRDRAEDPNRRLPPAERPALSARE